MKTLAALFAVSAIALVAQQSEPPKLNGAGINPPWSSSEVIQPADLAQHLKGALILQVGFEKLYDVKHVPGSIYAGPASRDLAALDKAVAGVPKTRQIVLYCGCCPWDHCPNMKPAYTELRRLGYSKIKIVHIANNFGTDWVDKGYPVESSVAK